MALVNRCTVLEGLPLTDSLPQCAQMHSQLLIPTPSAAAQGGSDRGFFRRLERLVAAATGVEPRCWYEPRYEWEEDNLVADEL